MECRPKKPIVRASDSTLMPRHPSELLYLQWHLLESLILTALYFSFARVFPAQLFQIPVYDPRDFTLSLPLPCLQVGP